MTESHHALLSHGAPSLQTCIPKSTRCLFTVMLISSLQNLSSRFSRGISGFQSYIIYAYYIIQCSGTISLGFRNRYHIIWHIGIQKNSLDFYTTQCGNQISKIVRNTYELQCSVLHNIMYSEVIPGLCIRY